MSYIDESCIESAAKRSIEFSIRSKYGTSTLNETDIDIISRAISDAIVEYHKQMNN